MFGLRYGWYLQLTNVKPTQVCSASATKLFQQHWRHLKGNYELIERLDQGHLYPQGERQDKHVTVRARISDRRAAALPKRLSKPLLGLRAAIQPDLYIHGSSSACAVHVGCTWNYLDVGRLAWGRLYSQTSTGLTFTQIAPTFMQINHVGVTTIERLDQGHLSIL